MENQHALWAKKGEQDGQYYWLPLLQHLEDTRQICGLLWEHWLSPGVRWFLCKNAFGGVSDDLVKRTLQLLGALHDLGKATPVFQHQEGRYSDTEGDAVLLERLERTGFVGIRDTHFPSRKSSPHTLAGQTLAMRFGMKEDLASVIGAHHGTPLQNSALVRVQSSFLTNYYQSEKETDTIYKKWQCVQESIFNRALSSNGFASVGELPAVTQPGLVLLSGLLIMADWIASNEQYFPLVPVDSCPAFDSSYRIQAGWMKWFKTMPWVAVGKADADEYYNQRFAFQKQGFFVRSAQRLFFDAIQQTEAPGLFILEAPMGVGKTEAALIGAEQLAYKTGRSGLFFGLPTQATANGIFPRLLSWLQSVDEEFGEAVSLRLVHGKAMLNPQFAELPKQMDEGTEDGIIVNEWFSGRKTKSMDEFIVGTVDQFLLMALRQKHLALRHLGFSNKVVIIDEVHAYDAYMNQYLLQAIRWLGAYHVPVILLSATLPADRRAELVDNYLRGSGQPLSKSNAESVSLDTAAYPLITYTDGMTIKQCIAPLESTQKEIQVETYSDDLYEKVAELLSQGGIIGIIVNTVKRAQTIAEECVRRFSEPVVEVLHSAFEATQRAKKEEALLQTLGKNGQRPKVKIIIGTQVLEQSLDIDFDVLLTDLAPMDLLIQRIGRLYRHNRPRPDAHQQPTVYVLETDETLTFDSGAEAIYGGYLLAKTQLVLPKVLHFPVDISPLVQKVYGSEVCLPDPSLKARYEELKEDHEGRQGKRKEKAKYFRLAPPIYRARMYQGTTLDGWLHGDEYEGKTEEDAYAQVRDGEEIIEVVALQKIGKGYGFLGDNEDISASLDDRNTVQEILCHTLRLPAILCKEWSIGVTIQELEEKRQTFFYNWAENLYLKGMLALLFNENQDVVVNGYRLHYNRKYGLTVEKEQESQGGEI